MPSLSRRQFVCAGLAASSILLDQSRLAAEEKPDIHQQILALAAKQEQERRQRFAAVATKADLEGLQKSLRQKFLDLLDGLPQRKGAPPARTLGTIDGDDYTTAKLVFESASGFFVPCGRKKT